jgi:hypothetical protein
MTYWQKTEWKTLFFFYHFDFIIVSSIIEKEKGSIDSVTKLFPKPSNTDCQLPMANENGLRNGL